MGTSIEGSKQCVLLWRWLGYPWQVLRRRLSSLLVEQLACTVVFAASVLKTRAWWTATLGEHGQYGLHACVCRLRYGHHGGCERQPENNQSGSSNKDSCGPHSHVKGTNALPGLLLAFAIPCQCNKHHHHHHVDADNYDACSQPCAADWPQYFVNTCQPVRAFCATLKDRSRHCAVFGQDHGSAAQPQALRPVLLERLGTYLARMASSYTKPREVSQSYLYHMCYVICTSVDVCIAHVYLHTYV